MAAPPAGSASLYLVLGRLYCTARAELMRLGDAAGLQVPKTALPVGAADAPRHLPSPPPARAAAPVAAAAAARAAPAAAPASAPAPAARASSSSTAVPAVEEEGEEGELQAAPSSSDLAQVDLGSGKQLQEAAQAAAAEAQEPPAAAADELAAGAAGLRLESTADSHADASHAAAGQLQRLSLRPKVAPGVDGALGVGGAAGLMQLSAAAASALPSAAGAGRQPL